MFTSSRHRAGPVNGELAGEVMALSVAAAIRDNQARTSITELREPCSLGTFF
jgi:hypothetical protein